MVELAEESIEEVPQRGRMTVADTATSVVMRSCGAGVGDRDERPIETSGGQPVVLDTSVCDDVASPGGARDRRGTGIGAQ